MPLPAGVLWPGEAWGAPATASPDPRLPPQPLGAGAELGLGNTARDRNGDTAEAVRGDIAGVGAGGCRSEVLSLGALQPPQLWLYPVLPRSGAAGRGQNPASPCLGAGVSWGTSGPAAECRG